MNIFGRHAELERFRAALAGDPEARPVHFLYGVAGAGKSTLLRAYAAVARAAGRTVTEIDGRRVPATPDGFLAAAGASPADPYGVLLVDAFEHCQAIEGWFWERFLPGLPAGAVVAVAGRTPPDPRWTLDAGWGGLAHVAALPSLAAGEATALLRARGVPPALDGLVLALTGGHPMALSQAAGLALRDELVAAGGTPRPDAVRLLLRHLIGEMPTGRHRAALEVCAHAPVTSEALLRTVAGDDAPELFAWLRDRPYIETTGRGLVPHGAVRETVEADLRARDPAGYARLHEQIRDELVAGLRAAPDAQVPEAAGDLLFLYGRRERHDPAEEIPYRPGHAGDVLRLADDREAVGHWLRRRPEAFRVYRDGRTGSIVGFFAWLPLTEDSDPSAAAARRHTRAGEPVVLARYGGQRPPELIRWRLLGEIVRASGPAWPYVVLRDDDLADLGVVPVGDGLGRACPVDAWLHDRSAAMLSGRAAPAVPSQEVLTRAEFDAALRCALRELGRPRTLAGNPLHRTRLVRDAGRRLDEILRSAAELLREERGGEKQYRALAMTYLKGIPSQKAAAVRLGLPFGTYRRHLTGGVDALADHLWRCETKPHPHADGRRTGEVDYSGDPRRVGSPSRGVPHRLVQ